MMTKRWKKSVSLGLALALVLGGVSDVTGARKSFAASEAQTGVSNTVSGTALSSVSEGAVSGEAVSEVTPEPTITPTPEKPAVPTSFAARGGSKRVRLTWAQVSGADGYYIYCRESTTASYTKIKTIKSSSTLTYDKTGLVQNTTYYFCIASYKKVDGVVYESSLSSSVYATTKAATKTSKAAKKYGTKAKFKKSPAYKKYTKMISTMNISKTFAIPGMINTNAGGFNCTSMVPQGITLAGSYFLISAYDSKGVDYSVIYVVSRSSKSYITTIVLPNKAKVGGIAYDGTNVWISKGSKVASFPYSFVTDAVNSGSAFKKLSAYNTTQKVSTTASYMAYYNGILWVGPYSTSTTKMYGYKVENVQTTPVLSQIYQMAMPSKTQGITITSDGTMVLTRAKGKNTTDSGYISYMRTYKPSFNSPSASGKVLKNSVCKKTKLPPKAEGVAIYGTYTYLLFSSSHYGSCKYPVDRVLALKTKKLVG